MGQFAPFVEEKLRVKNNTRVYQFNFPAADQQYLRRYGHQSINGRARLLQDTGYTKQSSMQVNLDRNGTVIPGTILVHGQVGEDIRPLSACRVECRVDFRPTPTYNGNFGFSWFREGELDAYEGSFETNYRTGEVAYINKPCNDQPFSFIMGRHFDSPKPTSGPRTRGSVIQDENASSTFFDPDPDMVEKHRQDYKKIHMSILNERQEYLVPVMTLRKGETATLQLFIRSNQVARRLEFGFDNPQAISEGYLSIQLHAIRQHSVNPPIITPVPIDPPFIEPLPIITPFQKTEYMVTIECHKEFSKELMLEAKAYPVLEDLANLFPERCGAVRLLPNDPAHQRRLKVVFFNVVTQLNPASAPVYGLKDAAAIAAREEELRRFLGQAHIIMDNIETDDLDITSGKVRPTDRNPDRRYQAALHQTMVKEHGANVLKNVFHPSQKEALGNFLYACISQPPYQRYILENYYIILFIDELSRANVPVTDPNTGRTTQQLHSIGGFSSVNHERMVVIFSDPKPHVPTHEVCHALGLPHTFFGNTSRAKYVYQDGTTNNIMDYSQVVGVEPKSLFHWQWKAINSKLP